MKIYYKKAQAALEFLTTYGWAFLVILIMISALAYFGILNPQKLLPDRCTFGTEFECQDYLLDASNGKMLLRLKNNVGEVINISDIEVSSETKTKFACTSMPNSTVLSSGDVKDFEFGGADGDCGYNTAGMIKGDKGKILITLTYFTIKSGEDYKHDVHGEIYSTLK